MTVSGNLIGLTPKKKTDGQVIEIKIIIPFDSQDLANLGGVFGRSIAVDIQAMQHQLEFPEQGGDVT